MKKKHEGNELVATGLDDVYQRIRSALAEAQGRVHRAVNFAMVRAYWEIGRIIVEEEQKGKGARNTGVRIFRSRTLSKIGD